MRDGDAYLIDTSTWFTNVSSQQLNVVDLTSAGSTLVTLVYPLKRGSQYGLGGSKDLDSLLQIGSGHTSDFLCSLRGISLDDPLELFDSDGVLSDIFFIDIATFEHFPLYSIEESEIGSHFGRKMDRGVISRRGSPWVDDDAFGRISTGESIEHSRPQDGLGSSDVVTDDEETVRYVDIGV
jgi:hypothetical protein